MGKAKRPSDAGRPKKTKRQEGYGADKPKPKSTKARRNLRANLSGYVTGPKGGTDKATRGGGAARGVPPTRGRKVTVGRVLDTMAKKGVKGKPGKTTKKKTDVDRGLKAISVRRHGTAASAKKPKRGADDKK